MRRIRGAPAPLTTLTAVGFAVATLSCSDGADPVLPTEPWPASPGTGEIASIEVRGPSRLQLHEQGLIQVTARDAGGREVEMPWLPVFRSSDSTVATISYDGVVRGVDVGDIGVDVSLGRASAHIDVSVWARMRIGPDPVFPLPGTWSLGIGDTLTLAAEWIDVDGVPVRPVDAPSWLSRDPAIATVDASGTVVSHSPGPVDIVATAGAASAQTEIDVREIPAGLPATVRFAHTAQGVGPVTFTPNKGDPVVLAYGETLVRTVPSGLFVVRTSGLSNADPMFRIRNDYAAVLAPDDRVSYFAIGRPNLGFLAVSWPPPVAPPAGQSLVRLIQGWNEIGIFYLQPTDAPIDGSPELCYFDPGDVSNFFAQAAGPFDIVLEEKYGSPGEFARFRAEAPDGNAVTFVLVGAARGEAQFLAFTDP